MSSSQRVFSILVFLIICHYSSHGQNDVYASLQDEYKIHVTSTDEKIKVDGILDEISWQTDEKANNFWLSFPIDNELVSEEYRTEAMMVYDDKYLYIAATCYGGAPYLMPTLKRDARDIWSGEIFGIVMDPLNEKTNAFIFAANTAGVQTESLISGGLARRSGSNSANLNSAWDQSWISEAKVYEDRWTIEMAIPFKSLKYGPNGTWGINFYRGVSETNEWQTWVKSSIEFMTVDMGHTGAMIWENPPKPSKRNIALIPYILGSKSKDIEANEPSEQKFRIGGDAKIAITSGLNLDLTINPDFSQVDVDEQVTNLSTVNIRFPERRLFFLENSDLYSDFGIPPMRPFFSRKIGLDNDGNPIPIAYGARLSGNVNKDLRMGLMNLQTRTDEGSFSAQNYTSFTAHQQLLGRSILKGYFHNRTATGNNENPDNDFNRIGGLEFLYNSGNGRFRTSGGYGKSWTSGLSGDDHFYSWYIGYNSRKFSYYTNFSGVGENYRSDMGFNPRFNHYDAVRDTTIKVGYNHGFTSISYQFIPENQSVLASHGVGIRSVLDYTEHGFDLIQNNTTVEYEFTFSNTSNAEVSFSHEEQGLLYPFAFTDEEPLPVGTYKFNHFRISYRSDGRRPFSYSLRYRNGGFYNGNRQEYAMSMKYRVQPWGNFSMNLVYNNLDFPAIHGSRELFLIGPKLEINFSRNLFWTTFLQFNTQAENFNINSRLQWRFKPLSDVFLVYTDNYATDIWGPKNRGIVLKMNYWVNL